MAWWKAWVEQEGVSVKGSPHFNPDPDAETLYKAMKGIGTNEQAIIDVLTKRSNAQRQQISKSFKAQFGKDLIETLKSELSGKFERLIIALMYPPYRYEAKELYDAMKGIGTKEGVIIEILASRTKNQLQEIMKAYEEDYGSNLEEDIKADTSGYLERILVCLLQGSRDDLSGYVDPGLALQDAQDLYAAGEKICGTDEMKFITILCTRSATHLLRVFEEYEKIANKSIEDSIKSETHGSLEEAMLTVVKCTRNLHSYFAERLYFAMKGAGTLDGTLIRNIVSRSEIDLNLIKNQFKKMYGKTLSSMIMTYGSSASGVCPEHRPQHVHPSAPANSGPDGSLQVLLLDSWEPYSKANKPFKQRSLPLKALRGHTCFAFSQSLLILRIQLDGLISQPSATPTPPLSSGKRSKPQEDWIHPHPFSMENQGNTFRTVKKLDLETVLDSLKKKDHRKEMKGDLPGIISGKIATPPSPAEPPTEHHPTPYPRTPPCLLTSLSHRQIQLWEPGIPLAHIQLQISPHPI
ncbi:hypothetical protein MJT46_018836 [Ovis ammon polii x Ovis aries]|nr:hypothetical protein MJT46_018836 [Ovis ammon polii x Ovis aries]